MYWFLQVVLSINQPINQIINQSTYLSINQPINQIINQSTYLSINQPVNQSLIKSSTYQSTIISINQLIYQSSHPTHHSSRKLNNLSVYKTSLWTCLQSSNQSVSVINHFKPFYKLTTCENLPCEQPSAEIEIRHLYVSCLKQVHRNKETRIVSYKLAQISYEQVQGDFIST
jgi:hypothetical protein